MSALPKLQVDDEMLVRLQELTGEPQTFTPPEPEPEPQHLVVEYHHEENETGHTTEDLIGGHFVGPMAGR